MNSKLFTALFILPFFIFLSCKEKSAAAPASFKIHFLNGDVRIESKTPKTPVIGMLLGADDTVVTGKAASADILIETAGIIRVLEGSRLKIASVTEDENNLKTAVNLESGKIFASYSKIKKNSSHTINTPLAVAAVRGTSFRVTADSKQSVIDVVSGKVQVNAVQNNIVIETSAKAVDENNSASVSAKELNLISQSKSEISVSPLKKADLDIIRTETAGISVTANTPEELVKEIETAGLAQTRMEDPAPSEKIESTVKENSLTKKELAEKALKEKNAQEQAAKEKALKEKFEQERIAKEKAEELKAQQQKAQDTKESRVKNIPNI